MNRLAHSNRILAQAAVILFIFWVVALILLTRPLLNQQQASDAGDDILQRLSRAVAELESLKEKNKYILYKGYLILNSMKLIMSHYLANFIGF